MFFSWLKNPNNLWGHWVNSALIHQIMILCSAILFIFTLPLMDYFSLNTTLATQQNALQQQMEQFEHQQKVLASLKQQSQVTGALAKRLPHINEQIKNLAKDLSVENSQWSFQSSPQITLQIKGNFPKLRTFLTALLQQHKEIELLSWHIVQLDEKERNEARSIHSRILLQLSKDK